MAVLTIEKAVSVDHEKLSHRKHIVTLILSDIADQLTPFAQNSDAYRLFSEAAMDVAYKRKPATNNGAYGLGYEYISSRFKDGKLDDEYVIGSLERMAAKNPAGPQ